MQSMSALGRAFVRKMALNSRVHARVSSAPWPALRVTYRVTASNEPELDARIESLLLEQTVELPRAALRDEFRPENIVGRLVSIKTIGAEKHAVVLDFPISATANDPAQFLNVLFGNSIHNDVALADFKLPGPKEWPQREQALPAPNSEPPACDIFMPYTTGR